MRQFIHNYNNIITIEKLLKAWQEFLHDKKDKKDLILFQARLMDNIFDLFNDLKNKTYKHGSYAAFNISDPKPRQIHKATVRDRLLHHLIYQELYSYFDSKFFHDSYSCRVEKGTHKAMNRFRDFYRKVSRNNTRTCWVLKCDIKKFFANIDHKILKNNKMYLKNLLPKISKFLSESLKLSLHPDKVFIKTIASGMDFLGWVHFPYHRVLRTATK